MVEKYSIRTEDLDLHYDAFKALSNVNIQIPEKTITAFIGPSGCGKTTLLKCFNRMNDLIANCRITGKIYVRDIDIHSDIDVNALRRDVGMVFQKPNVFPMSVRDNVTFGPITHGVKKKSDLDKIVYESLHNAGLWNEVKDRLNKSALGLSGGQQQRLCIARALAVSPDILLMDEPTSALDPISSGKIEDLCDELKSRYTIVIVTHNMQQAIRISDYTAFFLLGEMLEFGETEEVFSNPKNKKCENYITGRFG
ncbi:MAG: phosphate ABC transporter ATP-binding protein PstB [Christensenellaceae bacterium]|jgi:phosphate transport system ATP-binding protein|nr:phosphate ABC transporter ATP-binding protein PstB [Christensenellaceae bacterium]